MVGVTEVLAIRSSSDDDKSYDMQGVFRLCLCSLNAFH